MTLRKISIGGFKCFPSLELPLNKLTILTGYNSAGKSSAVQPLLLISQAFRDSPRAAALSLNGPLVRLGSAGEIVSTESDGIVSFGFETEDSYANWVFSPSSGTGSHQMKLVSMKAGLVDMDAGKKPRKRPLSILPENSSALSVVRVIRDVIYLGASRQGRAEAFPNPSNADPVNGDVGCEGEYAPWWYVKKADDAIEPGRCYPGEARTTIRGQLDAYLSALFPGASVNAEAISRVSSTRLEFKMGARSDWARPANVGFGLLYAFPIVMALITARRDQIVIIDSPEAHLHPSAQSEMGKILARFAAAGVQLVIETHSDHVLAGMRLAVAQGLLDSSSVAVHFFRSSQEGKTEVVSPRVDSNGALDQWPDGFFDQAELDLSALAGWK